MLEESCCEKILGARRCLTGDADCLHSVPDVTGSGVAHPSLGDGHVMNKLQTYSAATISSAALVALLLATLNSGSFFTGEPAVLARLVK